MSILFLLSFMACDFLQRREAVKGSRKNDACESLVLCSEGLAILERSGMKVARNDLKTHTHLSMLFQNRSETSDFHTAEVLSPTVVSPEPEVLLARDAGPNDPKRCEAVKSFFFTHQEIFLTREYESVLVRERRWEKRGRTLRL